MLWLRPAFPGVPAPTASADTYCSFNSGPNTPYLKYNTGGVVDFLVFGDGSGTNERRANRGQTIYYCPREIYVYKGTTIEVACGGNYYDIYGRPDVSTWQLIDSRYTDGCAGYDQAGYTINGASFKSVWS